MLGNLYNIILYQPLVNALVFFYNYFQDLGLAIILLTTLIRLILFPIFYKSAKDQAIMQKIAPQLKEIQRNHKKDLQKQTKATLELYRQHRVNPFTQILLMAVQLPILIALYQVFIKGIHQIPSELLYSFISPPTSLDANFLGLINLNIQSNLMIVVAAVAQYIQGKLSLSKVNAGQQGKELAPMAQMGRQMVYLGPIMIVAILYFLHLPSAIALYLITTTAFSIIQQIIINKKINK